MKITSYNQHCSAPFSEPRSFAQPSLLGARSRRLHPIRPSSITLAIPARAWRNLFLRILFAAFSNSRHAGAGRAFARRSVPARSGQGHGQRALLVRTDAVVVRERRPRAARAVLGRNCRIGFVDTKFLAARDVSRLLRLFSFLRHRRTGFLRLSIGRHAALRGLHLPFSRTRWLETRLGRARAAVKSGALPTAILVVHDLF